MVVKSTVSNTRPMVSARSSRPVWHWLGQRVTGVVLIPSGLWFIWSLPVFWHGLWHVDPAGLAQWLSEPSAFIAMLFFTIALFRHFHFGLEVIIDDYIHGALAHRLCHVFASVLCWGSMAVSVAAILSLVFRHTS